MFTEFKDTTGFDVRGFIESSSNFLLSKSQILRSYYSGSSVYIEDTLTELSTLINSYEEFKQVCKTHSRVFNETNFWDLVDSVDDLGMKLYLLNSYSKFLRSTIVGGNNAQSSSVSIPLGQNELIETISDQYTDDQISTFINNDLNEEKYTKEGGNILTFIVNRIGGVRNVTTIVDNPIGERIYGKDLDKTFTILSEDLKVLEPKDSLKQSFLILIGLKRGQIPENRDIGLDTTKVVGSSLRAIIYPTILRQIFESMKTDDSFYKVSIDRVNIEQDSVFIEINTETIIGDIVNERIEM